MNQHGARAMIFSLLLLDVIGGFFAPYEFIDLF